MNNSSTPPKTTCSSSKAICSYIGPTSQKAGPKRPSSQTRPWTHGPRARRSPRLLGRSARCHGCWSPGLPDASRRAANRRWGRSGDRRDPNPGRSPSPVSPRRTSEESVSSSQPQMGFCLLQNPAKLGRMVGRPPSKGTTALARRLAPIIGRH